MIGISGSKGSGKGVVADYLVEKHGFTSFGFADTLKDICSDVFFLDRYKCDDPVEKNKKLENHAIVCDIKIYSICKAILKTHTYKDHAPIEWLVDRVTEGLKRRRPEKEAIQLHIPLHSVREILQFVGTDIIRNCIDPEFHVRTTFDRIIRSGTDLRDAVIHDARFPNERQFIHYINGATLRVLEASSMKLNDNSDRHASENSLGELSEYDYVVVNDKKIGIENFHRILDIYGIGFLGR